jgi:hypothetical protein
VKNAKRYGPLISVINSPIRASRISKPNSQRGSSLAKKRLACTLQGSSFRTSAFDSFFTLLCFLSYQDSQLTLPCDLGLHN